MYDERNQRRPDFGLADVFGIRKAGEIVGTMVGANATWRASSAATRF